MQSGSDPKPKNYYQNIREEILPFVPLGAVTALDVGCGEGYFAARLVAQGVREVWGVEVAEDAARRASYRLEKVLVGDIGRLIPELPVDYFDVIVFNDVLEHLVDPYDVLGRIQACLSEKGVVVSSIPNVRFYPTFYALLAHREWEYEESGILDRTHLRFFTIKSIRRMYERLGYEVLRHDGINPLEHLPRRYRLANALLGGRLSDMRFTQFATVARPIRQVAAPQAPGAILSTGGMVEQ
jgi:2-polyprenyl-3-methyl-5-hydroxy-6-metoxy-1,4-benzoquinol methylase